jgi:hypothetical protein
VTPTRLHPGDVDAIAHRVVELLHEKRPARGLVDAATLAAKLGLSRDTVYRRASALGGVRVPSGGSRPRWRFDVAKARAALGALPVEQPPAPRPARRRRHVAAGHVELLPIRPAGRRAA